MSKYGCPSTSSQYRKLYYRENKEKINLQTERAKKRICERKQYQKFGNYLQQYLESTGMKASGLARDLELSREIMSKYLQGIYSPKRKNVKEKFCSYFGLNKTDLENLMR